MIPIKWCEKFKELYLHKQLPPEDVCKQFMDYCQEREKEFCRLCKKEGIYK